MQFITRKKLLVFVLLAAVMLLGISWRFGWFEREPSYGGKTVTEWLDNLVLYSDEQAKATEMFSRFIAQRTRLRRRGIPGVTRHRFAGCASTDGANFRTSGVPTRGARSEALEHPVAVAWFRLRGPGKAPRPLGAYWPPSQTDRKTQRRLHFWRWALTVTEDFRGSWRLMLRLHNSHCQQFPELHHIFVLARQKAWTQVAACAQIEMLRGALRPRPDWKGRAPEPPS